MASIEVEETIKRIQSHKGVKGVLIMNIEGIPIHSNLPPEETENYAALVSQVSLYFFISFLTTTLHLTYN
jgi:dynein light chain roadblock-type